MNWLDITLIVITIIIVIGGLVLLITSCVEDEIGIGVLGFVMALAFAFCVGILPFMVLDKGSGSTIGVITSVDKNFFGTTALYVKTSETTQEEYCIEFDEKLETKAKELIGKTVKIEYGSRVGLYSTGKCNEAPVKNIEFKETGEEHE